MRLRSWGMIACGLGVLGCRSAAFSCDDDRMCDAGRCEATGYCSFPDADCDSGYRYGEHAPAGLAGRCTPLGEESGDDDVIADDGSIGSPAGPDGVTEDPSGDPSGETTGITPVDCLAWWNCDWTFRREIVVRGDLVDTPLDDFPIPVILEDISDPARFGATGLDLRVVADDGALLDFEVDAWSPDAPAVIWVAVPRIEPGRGARAFLYYGNPAAPPQDTAIAVWDEGFSAVWHLTEGEDATTNANHAENQGSLPTTGLLGGARLFEDLGQRLVASSSPSLTDLAVDGLTITAWVRPESPGVMSGGRVLETANAATATNGFSLLISPNQFGFEFNRGAERSEAHWIDADPLAFGRWHHVALTFIDGEAPTIWVDTIPIDFEDVMPAMGVLGSDAGNPVGIGGAPYDDTRVFDGVIDELRVSRGQRPFAWLFAEYLAATGELVSLGNEQTVVP